MKNAADKYFFYNITDTFSHVRQKTSAKTPICPKRISTIVQKAKREN